MATRPARFVDGHAVATWSSPEMGTQVPHEQRQPWHRKFGLAEFVGHVEKLQEIVSSANSAKLWSVDRTKLKKMVGWGMFIEEVRGQVLRSLCFLSAAHVLQVCW